MDADIPVLIFAIRAFRVDMLLIESYRLTVKSLYGLVRGLALKMRDLRLSDLMVNGRLVNNKCGDTMARKPHICIYYYL